MKKIKLALARVNYSQLYKVYDEGKTYKKRGILMPYPLLELAGHTRRRGVEVRIFDGEVDLLTQSELAQEIIDWDPDFAGFTSTTPDINLTVEVCRILKEHNNKITTIIGGPHASGLPEDISRHACIDYVVVGDGEYPLDLIINKESNYSFGNSILDGADKDVLLESQYREMRSNGNSKIIKGNLKTLRDQPMPAYDLLDFSKYQFIDPTRGSMNTASIMSSRGCPFRCLYCFHKRILMNRDIDLLIKEIKYLVNEKDVRYFFVYDDTFTVNRNRAMEILKKIKELNIKGVNFQCFSRANLLDEELIQAMKDAHFVRLSMGVESGSEKILKIISKGVKKEDYIKACEMLTNAGIEARGSFILGHPYDTKETIRETIEFSKELNLFHANFNIMTPYPGSKIYTMALNREGLRFKDKKDSTNWDSFRRWGIALVETDDVSSSELEQFQKEAQMEFYTQDKVFEYYEKLFKKGNRSRFFFRPLNFAWQRKYGKDIPFWDALEDTEVISPN
jgi:radical SAM superfamily enzyme YgiQ (UPF0313 family)